MKTRKHLTEKLRSTSARITTAGRKAAATQIAGIVSICVFAITSSTLVMYSQETGKEPVAAETAAATATTLPAARTITDTKGREMAGIIVAKTPDAITFERAADRKRFEIQLDTLSDADKAFIAGLVATPAKKPRVLTIGELGTTPKMEKAGFEVTVVNTTDELKAITNQELESYDAVIVTRNGPSSYWGSHPEHIRIQKGTDNYILRERVLNLTSAGRIVAWRNYYKIDLKTFIENKRDPLKFKGSGQMRDQEPFVDVQGKAIFFSSTKYNEKTGKEILHEEIFDQVVDQLKLAIELTQISNNR